MAYTTNDKVRAEAGFQGNTNIDETKITDAVNAAHAIVVGKIGAFYTLPLSYTPAILELIERRLAAGFLLSNEYGEQAEGTSKGGKAKTDWAMEQLGCHLSPVNVPPVFGNPVPPLFGEMYQLLLFR